MSERKDTLSQIREVGEMLLENVKAQATSEDEKVSSAAPRAYYSISKVLLDVIELDVKAGRASKQEIASKLAGVQFASLRTNSAEYRLLGDDTDKTLQSLLKQAEAKQAEITRKAQFATIQPGDVKELIDILTRIFALMVGAISAYKTVKELKAKKQIDRDTNTKHRKQTRNRKRASKQ